MEKRDVRRAGTESWRFAHDIDECLHYVLYLRDALGLKVKDDAGIPPPLAGRIPDRSPLTPEAMQAAAVDWPAWWHAMVLELAPIQLGPPSGRVDQRTWLRELAARHQYVIDPPEWGSLAGSPSLRDAARALWVESCQWFEPARGPYLPPSCRDVFAWEQVRDSAERAAAEHDVSLGEVNACAEVLLVEGSWWQFVKPGVALCSIAAARDPATATVIHKEAFDSYLTR